VRWCCYDDDDDDATATALPALAENIPANSSTTTIATPTTYPTIPTAANNYINLNINFNASAAPKTNSTKSTVQL